jgi:hypothetical protein
MYKILESTGASIEAVLSGRLCIARNPLTNSACYSDTVHCPVVYATAFHWNEFEL